MSLHPTFGSPAHLGDFARCDVVLARALPITFSILDFKETNTVVPNCDDIYLTPGSAPIELLNYPSMPDKILSSYFLSFVTVGVVCHFVASFTVFLGLYYTEDTKKPTFLWVFV
ncbi:MAG: hypothetical protein NTX11_03250 [Candidatus Saccharibacteria bacterium]|nr:hypothetical protein [Candidatus Saccharibacteria bacterium]